MPEVDICRLRHVLLLTALDGVEEKVRGLADGADDYWTKPFALAELVARLEALSRAPVWAGGFAADCRPAGN